MFARLFLLVSLCLISLTGCEPRQPKTYKVAIDPLWYPLDFMNKENNIIGFSTELLTLIGTKEHLNLPIQNTNWDSLLQGLKLGTYPAVLTSLYPYSFNASTYDFSDCYLPLGPVLVVASNSTKTSLSDFKGKEIGALKNSSAVLLIEKDPEIFIRTYDKPYSLINDVLTGRIDGGLLPILTAESFTRGSFVTQLKIVSPPLNDEGLRLITLKGKYPDLIARFDSGLKKAQKKDDYEKLLSRWQLIQSISK